MKARIWLTLFFAGSHIICVMAALSRHFATTSQDAHVDFDVSTVATTALSRYIRDAEPTTQPAFCDRFIYPNENNNTFFSPMDPTSTTNTYPPNAQCVFVLKANPGHRLKLDFRNEFKIEPSAGCEFDYLEIRNGKHGYSKKIGRYCGQEFPPIIYSNDRYLWLLFQADENIEYEGFQAVYESVPQPTNSYTGENICVYNKSGSAGFVNSTDIQQEVFDQARMYSLNLDCLWTIEVQDGSQIFLTFITFEMEKKNDCDSNFVDVFGEITGIPSRLKNFCGVIAENVVSKGNQLHIRFFAEQNAFNSKFAILFTAYRVKLKTSKDKSLSECRDDEFDCDDDTCIDKDLVCNSFHNCKFAKDENICKQKLDDNKNHLIIIIVVFTLILGAMTTAFFISCIRKLIRDQKIIREHIRQSKESKLDEAGRISLKRSLENINRIAPRKQPSQQSQQRSIHILDDESNRYYQETMPPMTAASSLSRTDVKNEVNYNSRSIGIKDILDASQHSEKGSDDAGMCDMACQTRESLFAPVFKNKITQAPNTLPPGAIRFSTFGYDDDTNKAATLRRQSSHTGHSQQHDKSQTPAATIELEEFGRQMANLPPAVITCSKHQQHLHHMNEQKQQKKDNIKMEESRIYVDIRNSAPDVIIMTSH